MQVKSNETSRAFQLLSARTLRVGLLSILVVLLTIAVIISESTSANFFRGSEQTGRPCLPDDQWAKFALEAVQLIVVSLAIVVPALLPADFAPQLQRQAPRNQPVKRRPPLRKFVGVGPCGPYALRDRALSTVFDLEEFYLRMQIQNAEINQSENGVWT